jgi:hypothetical protein
MDEADLIAEAQGLVGANEVIEAAGPFGLQDNYRDIAVSGLAAGSLAPDNALGGAITGGAGVAMGQEMNARDQGVTVRMLVAVSATRIHVFALSQMDKHPGRELMVFERERTDVELKKAGLEKHLNLRDRESGQHLGLTGSTARIAYGSKSTKAVLAALGL